MSGHYCKPMGIQREWPAERCSRCSPAAPPPVSPPATVFCWRIGGTVEFTPGKRCPECGDETCHDPAAPVSPPPATMPCDARTIAGVIWGHFRTALERRRPLFDDGGGEQVAREAIASALGLALDCCLCGGTGRMDGGRWVCRGCNRSGIALAVTEAAHER